MQAEGALKTAKLDIEFTRVMSLRWPATSAATLVTAGNLVGQRGQCQPTLLTTVVSLDPIYFYFNIDEQTYLKNGSLAAGGVALTQGNPNRCTWRCPTTPAFPYEGRMDWIDNELDPGTGTCAARVAARTTPVQPRPVRARTPNGRRSVRGPAASRHGDRLRPVAQDRVRAWQDDTVRRARSSSAA